jgi:hypothetical protein
MTIQRSHLAVLSLCGCVTALAVASFTAQYFSIAWPDVVAALVAAYRAVLYPVAGAVLGVAGVPLDAIHFEVFGLLAAGLLLNGLASDYAHPRYRELPRAFRWPRRAVVSAYLVLIAGVVAVVAPSYPALPLTVTLCLIAGPLLGLLVAVFQSWLSPARA